MNGPEPDGTNEWNNITRDGQANAREIPCRNQTNHMLWDLGCTLRLFKTTRTIGLVPIFAVCIPRRPTTTGLQLLSGLGLPNRL